MGMDRKQVSLEVHENAQLAYLIELVLADKEFSDIHADLIRLSASPHSIREEVLPLSESIQLISDRLNLEPILLAFALIQWSNEVDLGDPGTVGSDNWFDLNPETLAQRQLAAGMAQEIAREIGVVISKLNADPIDVAILARRKSGELTMQLDKLIKKIQGELGRRKRLFFECSKRDLQIFYWWKVKGISLTDVNVLKLFEGEFPLLDLSVLENRTALSKKAFSRANEIKKLIHSVVKVYNRS